MSIYNYICLCLFEPSAVQYRLLESRRNRDINKQILQKVETYDTDGLSFEEVIQLVCKQYSVSDALLIISAYCNYMNSPACQDENLFCGFYFYFGLGKFIDPIDIEFLMLHEQKLDLWTVEKSDDRFDLYLLIKCNYYESIRKPLKSMRLLQDSLKREDPSLELMLVSRHIKFANEFYDDTAIEYFLNDSIVDKCFRHCSDAGHEIILLYLATLLRQDDLDKFFNIYNKFDAMFDLPRDLDIQRRFEFQLTEAYINSFQFDNARNLNGLFKYSIDANGYSKSWRAMAQTNFYLGNFGRSKVYFILIVLCFGLSKVSGADMKMLLGVAYKPINFLRGVISQFSRKTLINKTKKTILAQADQKISINSWPPNTAADHLKLLFEKGDYRQATNYYQKAIHQQPGDLLRGTFLRRRLEGLKQNNVISYLNTYSKHPTISSLLSNVSNFETSITPEKGSNVLILAHFGPGDELIASSCYPQLIAWAKDHNIKISIATQRRLIPIMRRTFPEIVFIENDRTIQGLLNQAIIKPCLLKKDLPSTNLLSFTLDARTQESLSQYDQISSTPLICSQFYEAYTARKIVPCYELLKFWRKRLSKKKSPASRLVGLSWRSSLVTKNRNIYYPDLRDLLVFEDFKNITFVNLQVNLSNREKKFFKQYDFDFIDFPDLCLLNDFDNVAALISNLDATISPFTTMGELSAALHDVPTIYLSPTLDTKWRLDDGKKELIYGGEVKFAYSSDSQSCTEVAKAQLISILVD